MNIINFFTFLVLIIGSASLFIVLSAFAGLKTFSLQFTNTFDPDLKAVPATGKFFQINSEEISSLQNINGLAHYSAEIVERVYLSFKDKNSIAFIKGVDENYRVVTGIDSTLYFGNWGVNEDQAVIGIGIFNLLGGPMGNRSPLNAVTLKPGQGSITGNALQSNSFYNSMNLIVSGVYAIEDDLDKKFVFAPLPRVQAFLEKDSTQVSGINFKLDSSGDLELVRKEVAKVLGPKVLVLSRQELNGTLHRMLKTENTATYLIFTLVLIIALFNLVGAIIMLILDKRENSKTLYALGVTISQLRKIYFLQGSMVTFFGGLMGVLLGAIIVLSQLVFEWWKITPSLAYPVAFQFENIFVVLTTIVVLGLLSSKIASSRISKKILT